jgi:hypothetical protein
LGLPLAQNSGLRVPNYFGGISGPDATGFGDITLGMKEQLGLCRKGFDLSVILAVSLPIGADRISSHGYDPFIKPPWSKELKGGWSIGGMQSLFSNIDGGKRTLFGSPRSTLKGKSQNLGRLSPSTPVTSRNTAGHRRSLTLARRAG